MKIAIGTFLFLTVIFNVSCYVPDKGYPACYGNPCPYETSRCKKIMESEHNGIMAITINCLDEGDAVLKTYYFKEPTTLNPYTNYRSTSYSSVTGGNTFNSLQGYRNKYNDVEQFL